MPWLGARSYSLYALHYPVVLGVYATALAVGVTRVWVMPLVVLVGLPLTALVVEVAYRLVERPSLVRAGSV